MGWKGTLRSINAASRKAERERKKRERKRSRDINKLEKEREKLDHMIDREIARAKKHDEKIQARPVKTLNIRYDDGQWSADSYETDRKNMKMEIIFSFTSNHAHFSPSNVSLWDTGIKLRPLALTYDTCATFIAFEVKIARDKNARRLRLVNRSTPQNSKIFLVHSDGEMVLPIDTSLAGQLVPGAKRTGVVAFDPFSSPVPNFEIVILPLRKSKKKQPIRIQVESPTMKDDIEEAYDDSSLASTVEQSLRSKQRELHAELDAAIKKAQAGCLVLFVFGGGLLYLGAFFL